MLSTPTLKQVEKFTVTGLHTRTQNRDEFNANKARLPNLWRTFHATDLSSNKTIFAVYSDYESDADGLYTVTVGITSEEVQAQFESVEVQKGNYLVFESKGAMPAALIETWKQVWSYFENTKEHQRNFISDFEVHSGPDKVAIYIGIR